MSDVIDQTIVLVLNRNWQAIDVKTPADAFCMLAANTATALNVDDEGFISPETWENWLKLKVRPHDKAILTVRGAIRIPTVIILAHYDKIPYREPKLTPRGIWDRDGGICQYTGRKLTREEGNIDHIMPKSRGGKTSWDNCVLADRQINSRKANLLPEEAGLRLIRQPAKPKRMPATQYIRNTYRVADWQWFLTG